MKLSLTQRLQQSRPLLLDGATGTELGRRGVDLNSPSWTARAILDQPEVLAAVHRDYALAGADVITANTFRTHARSLECIGRSGEARALTLRAVEIARGAAGPGRYVAGSVAPLEDCYAPERTPAPDELIREHAAMATHLAEAGVDLILIETQVTIREAAIAARAAAATGLPFWVSFTCDRGGQILSGELLRDGAAAVGDQGAQMLLVNCIPAEEVRARLEEARSVAASAGMLLGGYANTGRLLPDGVWEATEGVKPAVYAEQAMRWQEAGAYCLGGCCGTTPEHISAIFQKL